MTALIGPNMRLPSATGRAPPGRKSTWGSTTTRASCGPTAIGLIALRIADMNPSFTTPSSSSGKHLRGAENTLAGSADERADSTDRYRTDRTGARRAARGRRARRDRRAGGSRRGQRRDPPRRRAPAGGGDRARARRGRAYRLVATNDGIASNWRATEKTTSPVIERSTRKPQIRLPTNQAAPKTRS